MMVGRSINVSIALQLVIDALIMVLWRRGKPGKLGRHPYRASLYTSEDFQRLISDQEMQCSMSRKGAKPDDQVTNEIGYKKAGLVLVACMIAWGKRTSGNHSASRDLARAQTLSTAKPYSRSNTSAGADPPNRSTLTTPPFAPT